MATVGVAKRIGYLCTWHRARLAASRGRHVEAVGLFESALEEFEVDVIHPALRAQVSFEMGRSHLQLALEDPDRRLYARVLMEASVEEIASWGEGGRRASADMEAETDPRRVSPELEPAIHRSGRFPSGD